MPNLDGIIWQNPTVMESLAPIISDVTARMESTIKDKAKMDAALKAKGDEIALKKKIAEMKASENAMAKQAKLPTTTAVPMHNYDVPVLRKAYDDFYREIGEGNIDITLAENYPYAQRWNELEQYKAQAKERKARWDIVWEEADDADVSEYEVPPTDYLLTQKLAEEKYIESAFKEGKTAQEIYSALDGAVYKLPTRKPKEFEIQKALPSIPKRAITQQTRTEVDEKGAKQSVTIEIQDPQWKEKIRKVYDNDINIQALTDKYVPKNPDGTPNYEAVADFWKGYAQKEEETDTRVEAEAREKIQINTSRSNGGASERGKSSKKRRTELQYEPKGFSIGGRASTSFYDTDGSLAELVYKPPVEMINSGKTPVALIDYETGLPLTEMPGENLKKVGNNIQWIPINAYGGLSLGVNKYGGVWGGREDIVAVVPFAKYTGEYNGKYYLVPVTAIDREYEIIDADAAKKDFIEYKERMGKKLKQEDDKEQRKSKKVTKTKDKL